MSYIRYELLVCVFSGSDSDIEVIRLALAALPDRLTSLVVGPIKTFDYGATVAVLPAGDARMFPHEEAFEAALDEVLRVTPVVEAFRARFGGDEFSTELIHTTDTWVQVPNGEYVPNPKDHFYAPQEVHRGSWIKLGSAAAAGQMVRYFELREDGDTDKAVGLRASHEWVRRIDTGDEPDDLFLQTVRDLVRQATESDKPDGLEHLIALMMELGPQGAAVEKVLNDYEFRRRE